MADGHSPEAKASPQLKYFAVVSLFMVCMSVAEPIYQYLSYEGEMTARQRLGSEISLALVTAPALIGAYLIVKGLLLDAFSTKRPQGWLVDHLLPPEVAEHAAIELEVGFEKWEARYGHERACQMYAQHTVMAIALFWYSKIRRG